ncbi:hypothetical protein ILYODFUR_030689 [Ilyodon furcidens]|uniref:Uncharacterized protein n=1 Tax=Ilyodon furcidens TaxID=33524 RepID=A0ABV0TZ26_9TELE
MCSCPCFCFFLCTHEQMCTLLSVLLRGNVRTCTCMETCVYQACELLQAERDRVERLAQIVCEQRSQLDSCPEATKEPLQEQLARVSTHTHTHTHARTHTRCTQLSGVPFKSILTL